MTSDAPEDFSEGERARLRPFFTNLDRDVFGLRLPQEVAGALFSRYSRSTKSLRRTFLDEFLAALPDLAQTTEGEGLPDAESASVKKAREFYDRVLIGYGDDSVAQLGGAHIALERISNVAAKAVEDARIGIAPLEKSTRYVRFDKKDRGVWPYYLDPAIERSRHVRAFVETMDGLFTLYSEWIDRVIEDVGRRLPVDRIEYRHPKSGEPITYAEIDKDPSLKRWAESAYRSTVRAHACDLLRGLLPAATLTNVGIFGVGQAFERLLVKLYSSPILELSRLADSMHRELNLLIPSFVKRAKRSDYLVSVRDRTAQAASDLSRDLPAEKPAPGPSAVLVDYDRDGENKVVAAILYPHLEHPFEQILDRVRKMSAAERERIMEAYLADRKNRRDKPGRALENVYYTFDFLGNLGIYRDLQRHRILTQERQAFTTRHGFDVPQEMEEMGLAEPFSEAMEGTARLYEEIRADLPNEAEYAVPFAFRVRWYFTLNLREAIFISELRTMPQGHPDYRRLTQMMFTEIERVHPTLAKYARFVDRGEYRLGRLASEMRTEYKREQFGK